MGLGNFPRIQELVEGLYGLSNARGRVFYVLPSGNGELVTLKPPGSVFTNLPSALLACSANRGDVVVLFPGTHTLTDEVLCTKAGVTIRSVPGHELETKVVGSATAGKDCFVVSAADVRIEGLTITASNTTGYGVLCSANRCVVTNCLFLYDGATTPAGGVKFTDALASQVTHCKFESFGVAITLAPTANSLCDRVYITDCAFMLGSKHVLTVGSFDVLELSLFRNFHTTASTCILDLDSDANNTGFIFGNTYGVATNVTTAGSGVLDGNALPTGFEYANNYTQAGVTVAKPV